MASEGQENLDADSEDKDSSLQCLTFNSGTSWSNSITWSQDGRIAVLTDNCIIILSITQSPKYRKHGATFGLQLETNIIQNIDKRSYDVSIKTDGFSDTSKTSFMDRQKFLLDRTTVIREDFLVLLHSYCQVKWSPPGCTSDSRCVLGTRCSSGNVYVQKSIKLIGQWEVVFNITDKLHKYLCENNWLQNNNMNSNEISDLTSDSSTILPNSRERKRKLSNIKDNSTLEPKKLLSEYCRRKHLLFTESICWCPFSFQCIRCNRSNDLLNNASYAEYFDTYVLCKHKFILLLTASKTGNIFIWLLSFDVAEDAGEEVSLIYTWYSGSRRPVSTSWYQIKMNEGFIAIGYSNGVIKVFHLTFEVQDGKMRCQHTRELEVWKEADQISVSFLEWLFPKDGLLRLVCVKGTEIIVFKMIHDDVMVCSACEIAPSCHSTPITSLQCICNKYVLTSSWSATQYFDIENEILPYCERNILRGFKCFGITADPNLTMLARVSTPNRLLLLQPTYVKQLEISFLPFLSAEIIADQITNKSALLETSIREYFLLTSSENFLLPNILHKYCDEPASYDDKSMSELRLYLCFNYLRYIQQTGIRSSKEEDGRSDEHVADPVLHKIERKIEVLYFQEILKKCLQLLQHDWIKTTAQGLLSLSLIADWLILYSDVSTFDLPMECFELLQDHISVKALNELKHELFQKKDLKNISTVNCTLAKDVSIKTKELKNSSRVNGTLGKDVSIKTKELKNSSRVNGTLAKDVVSIKTEELQDTSFVNGTLAKNVSKKIKSNMNTPCKHATLAENIFSIKKEDNSKLCHAHDASNDGDESKHKCCEIDSKNDCGCRQSTDLSRPWSIIRETCPYCNIGTSIGSSKCSNNHAFYRCSLTLRIFCVSQHRECSTCHRKAKIKYYERENNELTIETILLNVNFCPFCGGRFRSAIS